MKKLKISGLPAISEIDESLDPNTPAADKLPKINIPNLPGIFGLQKGFLDSNVAGQILPKTKVTDSPKFEIPDLSGISDMGKGNSDPNIAAPKLPKMRELPKIPELPELSKIKMPKLPGISDLQKQSKMKIPKLPKIPELLELSKVKMPELPGISELPILSKIKIPELPGFSRLQPDRNVGRNKSTKYKKSDSEEDQDNVSVHSTDSKRKRKKGSKLAKKLGDELDMDNINLQINPPSFLSQLTNFQAIAGITLSLAIVGTVLGGMLGPDAQNALMMLNDAHSWTWDKYSYVIRHGAEGQKTVAYDECTRLCGTDGRDMLEISGKKELEGMDPGLSAFDKVSTFWTTASAKLDPSSSLDDVFSWRKEKSQIPPNVWGGSKSKMKSKGKKEKKMPDENESRRACTEYKWDEESKLHKLFPIPLKPPKEEVYKLLSSIGPPSCPGFKSCICKKELGGSTIPTPTQVGIEPRTTPTPKIEPTTVPIPEIVPATTPTIEILSSTKPTTEIEPPGTPAPIIEPSTTPIPEIEATTTEIPKPKKPFKCPAPGLFPDDFVCNMYHECVALGPRFNQDYKRPCGPGTVYCTDLQICGSETNCPCGDRIKE